MPEKQPPASRQHPVHILHRLGAAVLGLVLWLFAILGLVGGLAFLSTQGQQVLGMSTNGLLSITSLVAGAVLLGSALYGGPTASTVTTAMGALFLVSGIVHLAVLNTAFNIFAFQLSNVFFSLVAGMVLLFLGLYGRLSGGLPPDNPYRRARRTDPSKSFHSPDRTLDPPPGPDDAPELSRAEQATGEGTASAEQTRLVEQELAQRRREERERAYRHLREKRG